MPRIHGLQGAMPSGLRLGSAILLLAASIAAGLASVVPARAAAEPEIGTTVITVRSVHGYLGQRERPLNEGARVHLDEVLKTGSDSRAELQLDDDTKLALGPNGRLVLDDFVVGEKSTKRISLNVLKGALRFVTGDNDKRAYRIDTPSASIGVRGTVFDLYVHNDRETLILLLEGEIGVCSRTAPGSMAGVCRVIDQRERIVYACGNGIVSLPVKWAHTLLPGVPISTAFPFLRAAPTVDPVIRAEYPAITDESAAALRLISEVRERCRNR
jgi:hypothetical protein